MSRPARVLWLAKGLGRGGAEKLLVTGAAHVDPARFHVEVAYLLPHKDALVADLAARGVRSVCLDQRSPTDLRWVPRLQTLLRTHDYDLVHTHMPVPAVAARLLARRSRTGLVHTEHNVWARYRKPTYWANALTYRRNDGVVAVSRAVRASMVERYLPRPPATVEVLLHGVDHAAAQRGEEARAAARAVLGLPEDAFVIGNVANFTPKKDQRSLLKAVAELRRDDDRLRLVLIGSGPLEDDLRAHATALGVEDAVLFAGSRDDVLELLPALDLFCLSSLHEGLSIALVEALASGVPAVCTGVGGVPEVYTHEREGLLVPPADVPALVAALLRMRRDDAFRRRCAAAAVDRSLVFDIARATRRLEDLYDEVLARR